MPISHAPLELLGRVNMATSKNANWDRQLRGCDVTQEPLKKCVILLCKINVL